MNKSNFFENALLKLIFNNDDIANIGDAAGLQNSAVAGSLYIALHTADPGESGAQNTNEATYTGYARKAVARSSAGWTVTGNEVVNAADINFDPCTAAGANVIGWFSIGSGSSGATDILYKGALALTNMGPFTATTADVFTAPSHSLVNNDKVVCYPVDGSSLPTGITEGVIYYVISVSGDTFSLSATQGGAAINITAAGDGIINKVKTLTVDDGITPQFAAGVLKVRED